MRPGSGDQLPGAIGESAACATRGSIRAAEAPSRHLPLIAASPEAAAAEDYRQLAQYLLCNDRSSELDHPSPTEQLALHL